MQWHNSGGEKLSPRTGRPPKGEHSKTVSLQLRITPETSQKLIECSKKLNKTRTEIIELGIDLVNKQLGE